MSSTKKGRKKYECYSCGRSFSSIQGLGGHRKSCPQAKAEREEGIQPLPPDDYQVDAPSIEEGTYAMNDNQLTPPLDTKTRRKPNQKDIMKKVATTQEKNIDKLVDQSIRQDFRGTNQRAVLTRSEIPGSGGDFEQKMRNMRWQEIQDLRMEDMYNRYSNNRNDTDSKLERENAELRQEMREMQLRNDLQQSLSLVADRLDKMEGHNNGGNNGEKMVSMLVEGLKMGESRAVNDKDVAAMKELGGVMREATAGVKESRSMLSDKIEKFMATPTGQSIVRTKYQSLQGFKQRARNQPIPTEEEQMKMAGELQAMEREYDEPSQQAQAYDFGAQTQTAPPLEEVQEVEEIEPPVRTRGRTTRTRSSDQE